MTEQDKQDRAEVPVKVAVRIRPLLAKEKLHHHQSCVRVVANSNQIVVGKDRAFTFDYVLSSKSTQEEVYEKCVEPLVNSFFDGYNATIFAYGQTGSGKTYTVGSMKITDMTEEEYGIVPRAIKQIFDTIESSQDKQYTIRVSYIEIYKEELKDLLNLETSAKDLAIREDEKGNTVLCGIKEIICSSKDEVMSWLEAGSANRHTGTTNMNKHSSRSHSIFTLIVEQRWQSNLSITEEDKSTDEEESSEDMHFMNAKFHFVDLAGSERAHRTGNVGERFKESVHINSGLLALGNVISALGDTRKKVTHIPYRDSKITRILKDSLGGNANTAMISCISPSSVNFDETLNALKYANRARNIKNKPIVNRDRYEARMEEMQSEIQALREELQRQKTFSDISLYEHGLPPEYGLDAQNRVKSLEDQISRLKEESVHYKLCTEEAYKLMLRLQDSEAVSKSQKNSIKTWFLLVEELKSSVQQSPRNMAAKIKMDETVEVLEKELKKAKEDLASDEEIFAEKARQNSMLTERISLLEVDNNEGMQRLEEALNRNSQQEQQLVEQQLKIEDLEKLVRNLINKGGNAGLGMENGRDRLESEEIFLAPARPEESTSQQRAVSVPSKFLGRGRTKSTSSEADANRLARPRSRKLHSSPATFSLEKIVKNFRARSQVLAARLEETDEVLHQAYDSDSDSLSDSQDDASHPEHGRRGAKLGDTWKVGRGPLLQVTADTPKLSEGKPITKMAVGTGAETLGLTKDLQNLRVSTEVTQLHVKESQIQLQEAYQKMRDLTFNIKLKEELIRELVRSGKESEIVNKKFSFKIKHLEKESDQAKQELVEAQRALRELGSKEQHNGDRSQGLQVEYKRKIELAKSKVKALSRKQQDTEKMVKMQTQNEKKVKELELGILRMKQQQTDLRNKLKNETDRKSTLQKELQKDQQKIKELEVKNEQQQKILKRKTEEVAAAHRRLRLGSAATAGTASEDQLKIDEQKKWLDTEVEKVIERKQKVKELEEDLAKREEIIADKESLLKQKSELEIKRLRSSQIVNKDILGLASKIENVEKQIEEKSSLLKIDVEKKEGGRDEIKSLQKERERLLKQRNILDEKLQMGSLMSPSEEKRLIEMEEAIDVLDAAIEYRNEVIMSRQQELSKSDFGLSEENVVGKLNTLSLSESKTLLGRYFDKVVKLKESEKRKDLEISDMEVKLDEQVRLIHDLEGALQKAGMEMDMQLTQQQKEYEHKIGLLMNQLADASPESSESSTDSTRTLELKVQQLEKDLYYYKKTSRDLKRKLREMLGQGQGLGEAGERGAEEGGSLETGGSVDPSRHNTNPIRKSRKELRQLSAEEISMRRSQAKEAASLQADSIDGSDGNSNGKNPWT